jgi:outer membrane protein assembly factor BamB
MYNQKMGDLQGQRDLFAINKIYSMGELTTRPQADILETVGPIPERIPGGVVWQVNGLLSAGVRPVVQDGAVLVATRDRVLHCLELATGAQRWVLKLKGDPAGQLVQGPGLALLGLEGGYLLCVDLKTGKARWTASLDGAKGGKTNDGEIQPVTQPVLMDDKVFVGTFTRGTFKTGGNLYALDAAKGTRLWERPLPGGATHPPVAAMGLVWSGGWEQLSAYQTADGAEAKVFPLKNGAVEILTRTPARLYLRCALDAYEVDLAGRSMKPVPALAGGSGLTTGGDLLVQGGESARVVDSGTWTEA